MTNETTSPFQPNRTRKTDDTKLVAEVLGPGEASEMAELVGEKVDSEPRPQGIELSADETIATKEAEQASTPETRKKQYFKWADECFKTWDEVWLSNTFIFEPDGSVRVDGNLDLSVCGLSTFPPDLSEVTDNFYFNRNQFTSLEGMPSIIGGTITLGNNRLTSLKGLPEQINKDLYLNHNLLTSLEDMPGRIWGSLNLSNNLQLTNLDNFPKYVHQEVYLNDIPATSIPAGLQIGGKIHLKKKQTELIASCEANGYTIEVD